jgi:hypothetical protein
VWVCENGGKITKFIQNLSEKCSLLNISNAPSEMLAIFQADKKKLDFYSIPHVKQCLNANELPATKY